MANLNGFNASDVDPNVGFEPVPGGKYLVVINSSEMKPTKRGDGAYLQLELVIIEGPHKGRRLWDRLTLEHPNDTTVRIARGTLSAICRAVGVLAPKDSVELHNLPLMATVAIENRRDTGEPTNTLKGYAAREQASAPRPVVAAAGGTPPWKR